MNDYQLKLMFNKFIAENNRPPEILHVDYAGFHTAMELTLATLVAKGSSSLYVSSKYPELVIKIDLHIHADSEWYLS